MFKKRILIVMFVCYSLSLVSCKDKNHNTITNSNIGISSSEDLKIDEATLGRRVNILIPNEISQLYESSLFCDGRRWFFNEKLKPYVKNNTLYITTNGSFYTLPEEISEKPLPALKGKQIVVFELIEEVNAHIIIKYQITTSEFKIHKNKIDAYKKKKIMIPLPKEGKTINHFQTIFSGEESVIGIKAIYMQ